MNLDSSFRQLELQGLKRNEAVQPLPSFYSEAQPIAKSEASQMTLKGFVGSDKVRIGAFYKLP